jgi:hypothetical protein
MTELWSPGDSNDSEKRIEIKEKGVKKMGKKYIMFLIVVLMGISATVHKAYSSESNDELEDKFVDCNSYSNDGKSCSADLEFVLGGETALKFTLDQNSLTMRPVVGVQNSYDGKDVYATVETNGSGYMLSITDTDNNTSLELENTNVDLGLRAIESGEFSSNISPAFERWGFSVGDTKIYNKLEDIWDNAPVDPDNITVAGCRLVAYSFCGVKRAGDITVLASKLSGTVAGGERTQVRFGMQILPETLAGNYQDRVMLQATPFVP